LPPDAKIEFSIASKGKVILLGSGESFMNAVLSVQSGSGMVDQALYKHAAARALPSSQVTLYLDIRDVVALAEKAIPTSGEKTTWETDVKPYVVPFETLLMNSASTDGSSGHARFTLTLGNP